VTAPFYVDPGVTTILCGVAAVDI